MGMTTTQSRIESNTVYETKKENEMSSIFTSTYDTLSDLIEIVRKYQALIYSGTFLGLMIAVLVTR